MGIVNLTVLLEATLATKLHGAKSQPLARMLALRCQYTFPGPAKVVGRP